MDPFRLFFSGCKKTTICWTNAVCLALQMTSDLHLIITLQGKYNYPHFLDEKWLNILPKVMWLPRFKLRSASFPPAVINSGCLGE